MSVKNVDFYKTEHDFINDDPFNMPLSQEEKTYPIMTNGNRRTFFQPEPRCPAHSNGYDRCGAGGGFGDEKDRCVIAAVLVIIS